MLVYCIIAVFFGSHRAHEQAREEVMGRVINAELVRLGLSAADLLDQEQEKQKRGVTKDEVIRLSDDGELLTEAEVVLRKTRANI